jgi:hypothetical protein
MCFQRNFRTYFQEGPSALSCLSACTLRGAQQVLAVAVCRQGGLLVHRRRQQPALDDPRVLLPRDSRRRKPFDLPGLQGLRLLLCCPTTPAPLPDLRVTCSCAVRVEPLRCGEVHVLEGGAVALAADGQALQL